MLWLTNHVRIQRGGTGGPDPLDNYKNIGFLSNTGPDPLKSQSYQVSIQCWAIIGPPAKRHLNGVSLAGQCWPAKSGILILTALIKLKKTVKVGPPPTKLSGSLHVYCGYALEVPHPDASNACPQQLSYA